MRQKIELSISTILSHYEMFRAAIVGSYYQATQLSGQKKATVSIFIETTHRHYNSFSKNVSSALYDYSMSGLSGKSLQRIAELSPTTTKDLRESEYSAIQDYLSEREIVILSSIESAAKKNVDDINKAYRHYLLGMSALTPLELKNAMSVRDTINRKSDASRHIQLTTASGLYDMVNTSSVFVLLAAGESEGKIDRPGHESHGYIFPLTQYTEMLSDLFHPNAKSLVVHI